MYRSLGSELRRSLSFGRGSSGIKLEIGDKIFVVGLKWSILIISVCVVVSLNSQNCSLIVHIHCNLLLSLFLRRKGLYLQLVVHHGCVWIDHHECWSLLASTIGVASKDVNTSLRPLELSPHPPVWN